MNQDDACTSGATPQQTSNPVGQNNVVSGKRARDDAALDNQDPSHDCTETTPRSPDTQRAKVEIRKEDEKKPEPAETHFGGIHSYFWKARYRAVCGAAFDDDQLVEALKETPHMKEDEREIREAIKAESIMTEATHSIEAPREPPFVFPVTAGGLMRSKLTEIYDKAREVELSLHTLSLISGPNGTVAKNTKEAEAMANRRIRIETEARELLGDADATMLHSRSLSVYYSSILTNKKALSEPFDRNSLTELDCGRALQRVSRAFSAAMPLEKRAFMGRRLKTTASYRKNIDQTVKTLRPVFKSALENYDADDISFQDLPFIFPGPTSQEFQGVHPILKTLLEAIADCCQMAYANDDRPLSLPNIGASEQNELNGNEEPRGRRRDIAVWKCGSKIDVLLDGFVNLNIRVTPGQRIDMSVEELQVEGRELCLRRLSESLLESMGFARGAGVPSHATSVLASLTHIEILQLHLLDPGKSTSRVELRSSGPLPLVPKQQFCAWFSSDPRHNDATNRMADRLYPSPDNGLDKDHIPLGIKALYAIMMCPSRQIIGPHWGDVPDSLGDLLGVGAFGTVFDVRPGSKSGAAVVKLVQPWHKCFVKNEAAVLKLLSTCEDTMPANIPRVVALGLLPVKIGDIEFPLPALAMQPRGQSIYTLYSCWSQDKRIDIIKCILNDIKSALSFIHKQGIVHGDVNDTNILLVPGEQEQWNAVLVDYGVASAMYRKISGFVGTPPYVHREIHMNGDWVNVPQYDETSLGFTMVVLLEGGAIPWTGLYEEKPRYRSGDVYEKRIDRAKSCLARNELMLDTDTSNAIEDLFLLDEKVFQCRCRCSKGCCSSSTETADCKRTRKEVVPGCTVLCSCYNEDEKSFQCESGYEPRIPKQLSLDTHDFDHTIDL